MGRLGLVIELFRMVWAHRLWMIVPVLAALVVLALLIVLAEVTPLGPFIYPLF